MRGLSYEVGVEGWQWSEFWGVVAIRSERFPGMCFHEEMAEGGFMWHCGGKREELWWEEREVAGKRSNGSGQWIKVGNVE